VSAPARAYQKDSFFAVVDSAGSGFVLSENIIISSTSFFVAHLETNAISAEWFASRITPERAESHSASVSYDVVNFA